jgi:hypothetical protein
MTDLTLTISGASTGPFLAWGSDGGRSRICFGTDRLYLVSNNVFCTVTVVTTRINELITLIPFLQGLKLKGERSRVRFNFLNLAMESYYSLHESEVKFHRRLCESRA